MSLRHLCNILTTVLSNRKFPKLLGFKKKWAQSSNVFFNMIYAPFGYRVGGKQPFIVKGKGSSGLHTGGYQGLGFVCVGVLGITPRTLRMPGKRLATEPHPSPEWVCGQ